MDHRASPPEPRPVEAPTDRLDSWKDIATYLERDVRTVQRWEQREAMPVHRHLHDKLGSIYAFRSELDAWRRSRQPLGPGAPPTLTCTAGPRELEPESRELRHRSAEPHGGPPATHPLAQPADESNAAGWMARAAALLIAFATGFVAHMLWSEPAGRPAASRPLRSPIEYGTASGEPVTGPSRTDHEYRLARYYMWRYDEESLALAIRHFERALQMDPTHAAAQAALSNAWWARGMFGSIRLRDAEAPARDAARNAMLLDDRLPAAYVAQADVERLFDKDPAAAEQLFRRALALDPNSVEAHHSFALLLMALGRFPEALAHIQRAAALDPTAPAIQSNFGRILYRAGRFDDAVLRFDRALELEPEMRVHYVRLGDVYDQLGQYDRALDAYNRSRVMGPAHQARVARVLARMGRQRDARLLLDTLPADESRLPLTTMAAAYAALGETVEAMRLLRRTIERDEPGLPYFPVDPQFATLRAEPQWPALLQRTGHPIVRHQ